MHAALLFNPRRHQTVLIGAGLLVAALLVFVTSPRPHPDAAANQARTPVVGTVVVAGRAIAAGTIIDPSDIVTKTTTKALPGGALSAPESAVGRLAGKSIGRGEMLLQGNLRDAAAIGISAHLAAGERAFAIHVGEDDIVGGFLQSGDHVDILATIPGSVFPTRDAQNLADRSHVLMLAQNIFVLAVGENPATAGVVQPMARTVSLAMTPVQLGRLTLALRLGKVSLAIRKPGDNAVGEAAPTTLADLLPALREPALPAPAASAPHRPAPLRRIPFYTGTSTVSMEMGGLP